MKKTLLVALMPVLLMSCQPAAASWLSSATDSEVTSDFPVKESVKYEVEAYGFNFRVYEWTPENNPNMNCILVATSGDTNAVQVECFIKR